MGNTSVTLKYLSQIAMLYVVCRTLARPISLRMRLTLKFLLKSLIGLIFLIFVLPMLIHHLDSQEWKKLDEVARSKRDRMAVAVSATAFLLNQMLCDSYDVSASRYITIWYDNFLLDWLYWNIEFNFCCLFLLLFFLEIQKELGSVDWSRICMRCRVLANLDWIWQKKEIISYVKLKWRNLGFRSEKHRHNSFKYRQLIFRNVK